MPYFGSISQAAGYTLEVVTTSRVSLTIINIRRDRISEVESMTFDGSSGTSPPPIVKPITTNVGRLVFLCSALPNEACKVKVTAGGQLFEAGCAPDGQLAFDVT